MATHTRHRHRPSLRPGRYTNTVWSGVVLVSVLLVQACQASPPESTAAASAVVQQVSDSHRLYRRALARQDAAMLAVAAELRAEALGTWQPQGNTAGGLPTPREMIGQAKQWAAGDEVLVALVERFGRRRYRGNTNGPLVRHVMVNADMPFRVEASFTPEFPAVIYLEGVPNAKFAVRVLDADGTPVCEDDTTKAYKLCRFLSERPEPYAIEAASTDGAPVELLLITN